MNRQAYSDLPNNCAANLIIFWEKTHLHNLAKIWNNLKLHNAKSIAGVRASALEWYRQNLQN